MHQMEILMLYGLLMFPQNQSTQSQLLVGINSSLELTHTPKTSLALFSKFLSSDKLEPFLSIRLDFSVIRIQEAPLWLSGKRLALGSQGSRSESSHELLLGGYLFALNPLVC